MDIFEAIKNSNLAKYQAEIDKCNKKRGCDRYCTKAQQDTCIKLIQHTNEMANLKYD